MTYRERRERKAERLRGWADKREARSDAALAGAQEIADGIPFGQPILVGHHSEGRARRDQARIESGMRRGIDDARKAEEMRARADNIDAAAEHAIYDDDPDALERLDERIAALEAERDRVKAYNASCRRGSPDESLLDERQRSGLEVTRRVAAYSLGKGGAMPAYVLSNLGGNIRRNKQRREALARRATS